MNIDATHRREVTRGYGSSSVSKKVGMILNRLKWSALRLIFFLYLGFAMFSIVGGFVTAPVMTYYFFGDWRFWRHWRVGIRLFPHGWRMFVSVLRQEGNGYMFNVPLASAPTTHPDRSQVRIRNDWHYGVGCGYCRRCCEQFKCPILDKSTGLCGGYNSFFWRYFNCGRFPKAQLDIDFYHCPKWEMRPQPLVVDTPAVVPIAVGAKRQAQAG